VTDMDDVTILMRLKRELNAAEAKLARLELGAQRRKLVSEQWEVRFGGQSIYWFTTREQAKAKRATLVAMDGDRKRSSYQIVRVRRFRLCRASE